MIFFDTCALLHLKEEAFKDKFYISNISLMELENIKTSAYKDDKVKYNARAVVRLLEKYSDQYEIILFKESFLKPLKKFNLIEDNNDTKILSCAYSLLKDNNVVFVTKDLSCHKIAQTIGLMSMLVKDKDKPLYTGFKEVNLSEVQLADFYNVFLIDNNNYYNLLENQYLIINDSEGKHIAKYKWKDNQYVEVRYQNIESQMFGKICPKNNDAYQQLAIDSLYSNQITMLRGPAGTGKSLLAFAYMFHLLDKKKIDKIIVFCNTVATRGSAKLGFYPGSRTEKLLDSQIGNLLESKLGNRAGVERLIDDGQLVLLPLSDIRGYDTTGMNAAIYISEAQNLDIELMRLALQRVGENSICILDGDSETQVDMTLYEGSNNGMKRVSEVFRGADFYGEVTLQNIYRSKIASLAQEM